VEDVVEHDVDNHSKIQVEDIVEHDVDNHSRIQVKDIVEHDVNNQPPRSLLYCVCFYNIFLLVRNDMDVDEHERLSNFIHVYTI
jgi:hypothetical protein